MKLKKITARQLTIGYSSLFAGRYSFKDVITSFNFKNILNKKTVLTDLNFEILEGDSIGILGKNGAGKSTLLKAVAGMLKPFSGELKVEGVVAPVLSIGTGIELELSGLENIDLLYHLILKNHNFNKKDIIQQIIAFSELDEQTLKQPVKTYSTGMVARLSFSIATATQPDILIIDEVLAVGDANFQQKCIQRIEEFRSKGSTILFVSHNPGEVQKVCNKAMIVANGRIQAFGDVETVLDTYTQHS